MAFTRMEFEKVWTKAEDFPAYEDSETQVREDLQYHPNALRDFINALIRELEAGGAAAALGAADETGAHTTVQSMLERHADKLTLLADDIAVLASGGVPSVVKNNEVFFDRNSWAETDNMYTLTIPKSDHGRENEIFGYNLYQKYNGIYTSGTESTGATHLTYSDDGSIVLKTYVAYSGKIVLFGA